MLRLAFVGLVAVVGSVARAAPDAPVTPAAVAAIAPVHLSGELLRTRLREPSSRVRVVNFWATWCQPCVTELPTLKAFAASHPDVDMILVNVDVQSAQSTRVTRALTTYKVELMRHWWLDSDDPNATLRAHVPNWASEIPFTLVIGRDGALHASFVDAVTTAQLDAAVAKASAAP